MKTAITAFLFLIGITLAEPEKAVDPFAEPPPKKVDRSADKKSVDFISDDILNALQERRLDKVGNEASGVVRITALRSFHPPLAFLWFPAPEGQESWLEVKRVRMQIDKEGRRTYIGLDLNSRIRLRPSQTQNLQDFFFQRTRITDLPQGCWQPESLDGSTWIFEFPSEVPDRSTLLMRRNPIHPPLAALEASTISKERLLQESALTSFALMIWTLSGIDDVPPY